METIASSPESHKRLAVIVQFAEGRGRAGRAAVANASGIVERNFDGINSVLASVPVREISRLAMDKTVAFITPDREIKGSLDSTNILVGTNKLRQPSPSSYGGTYSAVDGSGIGIAVIDSGINAPNQDDFRKADGTSRIVHFKDWAGTPSGQIKAKEYDDYGHGTPVSGVIAGNGWASRQLGTDGREMYPGNYGDFVGMAPNANIISLRVLNKSGAGSISNAISAIDYAISKKQTYNIRIINMSFGAPVLQSYKTDPLCLAVKRAVEAGIVVVASAGNHGHNDVVVGYDENGKPKYQTVYGSISSPGNSPYAITVGAAKNPKESVLKWHFAQDGSGWVTDLVQSPAPLRRTDVEVASFSSRGPTLVDGLVKPDVIAPGVKIIAANTRNIAELPTNLVPGTVLHNTATGGGVATAYVQLSGTSFAAPVVSGIAALMLQANPSLTPGQVKALIMFTSQRVKDDVQKNRAGAASRLLSQGAGLVNALAAVRLAQNARTDANTAPAGGSLLMPGRTLEGLNEDLKLLMTNPNTGAFTEKAVFNNGILLADGILLSDGLLIADGMLSADGILIADGLLLADGIMVADGILIADGIMVADGSLFPEGLLIADGVLEANYLATVGNQKFVNESTFQNAVQLANKTFHVGGVNQASGNAVGRTVFSSYGRNIWGKSMLNPMSIPGGVASESTQLLASEDDAPISGVTRIGDASPYYPVPQE